MGKKIAELCKEKDISRVCFDRGGFIYHGRVQVTACSCASVHQISALPDSVCYAGSG